MVQELKQAQILMLPGGFSAGDEPDGSGKIYCNRFYKIRELWQKFVISGKRRADFRICNGFQALIKSGLLPYGRLGTVTENSPTLTFNKIGRHVSQMVRTKILSNQSPWLLSFFPSGEEFIIPVSRGEGRFYVQEAELKLYFNMDKL